MVIGDHMSTHYLYVTNLDKKEMVLDYTYLYQHNPTINWKASEWKFTRCTESCANRRAKKKF